MCEVRSGLRDILWGANEVFGKKNIQEAKPMMTLTLHLLLTDTEADKSSYEK